MFKQTQVITAYSNTPVPELTDEQGIALSDLIEAFYKQVNTEVFDVALTDK